MSNKIRILLSAALTAGLFLVLSAAPTFAQFTSSIFESQMYNPFQAANHVAEGTPYNYIGTPSVTSGAVSYQLYQAGDAYTNTEGATISIDDVSGSYGGNTPGFTADNITVNAETDYGVNHAEASVGSFNDPYFQANAQSSWTDQFAFSSTVGNTTADFIGDTVHFEVAVDTAGNSQITGDASAIVNVSAEVTPDTSGVSVFGTTGGLGVDYSKYDTNSQGFFDPVPLTSDNFSFSGGGSAILVTQSYLLTTNTITPTVTLNTEVNPGAYLPYNTTGSGTADFSQTASLAGIMLYNSSGQLINPDTYAITPLSGGNYSFLNGGSAPAPESQTVVSFVLGLFVLAALSFASRRKRVGQAS